MKVYLKDKRYSMLDEEFEAVGVVFQNGKLHVVYHDGDDLNTAVFNEDSLGKERSIVAFG